jgi:hypothetical protein
MIWINHLRFESAHSRVVAFPDAALALEDPP